MSRFIACSFYLSFTDEQYHIYPAVESNSPYSIPLIGGTFRSPNKRKASYLLGFIESCHLTRWQIKCMENPKKNIFPANFATSLVPKPAQKTIGNYNSVFRVRTPSLVLMPIADQGELPVGYRPQRRSTKDWRNLPTRQRHSRTDSLHHCANHCCRIPVANPERSNLEPFHRRRCLHHLQRYRQNHLRHRCQNCIQRHRPHGYHAKRSTGPIDFHCRLTSPRSSR